MNTMQGVRAWTNRHYVITTADVMFSDFGPYVAKVLTTVATNGLILNRAVYSPIHINEAVTVYEAGIGTGTGTGNIDIGVYDEAGTRLVSSGSTARTASAWNTIGLTDTVLYPGKYWIAMSADNTNGVASWDPSAGLKESLGGCTESSAFPLPSTATFVRNNTTTPSVIPAVCLAVRSVAL